MLSGGAGIDTISYEHSGGAVSINLATNTASGADAAGDTFSSIEAIRGSAFGDVLVGNAAANTLFGDGGDDTLSGGAGADTLDGGAGIDLADYSASAQAVSVNLSTGTGIGGDAQGDVLTRIENVLGTAGDDTLTGDAQNNVLTGGLGDDTLTGLAGVDTLLGGDGNDVLEGGSGADVLDGSLGIDTASYAGSSAAVTIDMGAGTYAGGDAAGDTLISIENIAGSAFADSIAGDAQDNQISGGGGNDTLYGAAGADTLMGEGGNDVLVGGLGSDVLDGGTGIDTADYSASSAAVTVSLANGIGFGGDADGDALVSIENLTGSAFDDTLLGDQLLNRLTGGTGDDTARRRRWRRYADRWRRHRYGRLHQLGQRRHGQPHHRDRHWRRRAGRRPERDREPAGLEQCRYADRRWQCQSDRRRRRRRYAGGPRRRRQPGGRQRLRYRRLQRIGRGGERQPADLDCIGRRCGGRHASTRSKMSSARTSPTC